jgi:hypothetical protein
MAELPLAEFHPVARQHAFLLGSCLYLSIIG